jgi:hypothetical protein
LPGKVCSRKCVESNDGNINWTRTNCNECIDKEFSVLLEQVKNESDALLKNQTVIVNIARELSVKTNKSEGLSSGNLNASVMLINRLADLKRDSTVNTSAEEIKSIVQAASNVLRANNSKAWNELTDVNKSIATSILSSLEVYGEKLSTLNTSEHRFEKEDNLVLEAWSFEKSNRSKDLHINFPNGSVWDESHGDGISITIKTETVTISPNWNMWGVYYRTVNEYLPSNNDTDEEVNSRVLAFSISGLSANETLNPPAVITLHHIETRNESFPGKCSFWRFDSADWGSDGCNVTSTNSTHTICSCDHLTNFAILMSRNPLHAEIQSDTPSHAMALDTISTIGCSISLVALILTVIVYAVTWKQAKSAQATVLLNLCVALIIAYSLFLLGADKIDSSGYSMDGCRAIAALLHYFFLVAFFIMLIEGVELVLYIIFVFHVRRTRETIMLIAAAWVLPLIIVGVSLGVTKLEGYGNGKACWLSGHNHLIWAFAGPVLCIITINFIILITVLTWMSRKKALLAKNAKKRDEIRATIWNLSVTCPVLGLGWLFGVFSLSSEHAVFQYVFVIANSLQGLLIFIFHALFHNKKMNEKITAFYSNYICRCRKTDQSTSTKMTSSQDQSTSSRAATEMTSIQEQTTFSKREKQTTSAENEYTDSIATTEITSFKEQPTSSIVDTQLALAQEDSRPDTEVTQQQPTSSNADTQMTVPPQEPANSKTNTEFTQQQPTSSCTDTQMAVPPEEPTDSRAAREMTSGQEQPIDSKPDTQIALAQDESTDSRATTEMTSGQEQPSSSRPDTQMTSAEGQPKSPSAASKLADNKGFVPKAVKYYEEFGKHGNLPSAGTLLQIIDGSNTAESKP